MQSYFLLFSLLPILPLTPIALLRLFIVLLVIWHLALRLVAFIQLFPRRFECVAVAAPIVVVAALAVPAYIRVRGFRVMPDDKLRVPDSAALYDFIALIGACFTVHRRSSSLFAFRPYIAAIHTGRGRTACRSPRSGKYRTSCPWMQHKNHHKNKGISGFPCRNSRRRKSQVPYLSLICG